jgi:hypothetical protein
MLSEGGIGGQRSPRLRLWSHSQVTGVRIEASVQLRKA